ncbi:AtpZ/AtpI family protein [Nitrosomonas marina]|uniref:ATP synthase protein I n=1 Tax=Nitrosomonas marina TaxID=917 RepID=A0A1H8AHN8_9PROT|nr:AtpZ/AtpI family protein [Nitrosomonas marina]SEM70131.1 ATP synthase protein I [Nitrosomonas marina]
MNDRQLRKTVEKQIKRMKKAEKERSTLIAQTIFMGTLSLLFILPVLAGIYLGIWLDDRTDGYSIHWTIGLMLLGIIIGVVNVYLFVREHK